MEHGQNFYAAISDAIGENVGRAGQNEFAGSMLTTGVPDFGMMRECHGSRFDQFDKRRSGWSAVAGDVGDYLIEFAQ